MDALAGLGAGVRRLKRDGAGRDDARGRIPARVGRNEEKMKC